MLLTEVILSDCVGQSMVLICHFLSDFRTVHLTFSKWQQKHEVNISPNKGRFQRMIWFKNKWHLISNPITLRTAKTLWSVGCSECNRAKTSDTVTDG